MASPEQQRVLDIASFREEIARLERDGIAVLDPQTSERVRTHHDSILASLAARDDVDLSHAAAQLSYGMRIATWLGAAALSAAYGFFVIQVWGTLDMVPQLLLVSVPPLLLVGLAHLSVGRETSRYVASVLATVAIMALWAALAAIGALFNLPDSRELLLAIGVFALVLAYLYELGLPLLIGIGTFGGWLWSFIAIPLGLFWREGFMLLDPLLVLGLLCMLLPEVVRRPAAFGPLWRNTGALAFGLAVIMLGMNGKFSAMDGGIDRSYIEAAYQILAAVSLPTMIVVGVRRDWNWLTVAGVVYFIWFLLLRLKAWFWDYLPKWAFFLLVGLLAVLVLVLLQRMRARKAAMA